MKNTSLLALSCLSMGALALDVFVVRPMAVHAQNGNIQVREVDFSGLRTPKSAPPIIAVPGTGAAQTIVGFSCTSDPNGSPHCFVAYR